jgi:hypothetical protein
VAILQQCLFGGHAPFCERPLEILRNGTPQFAVVAAMQLREPFKLGCGRIGVENIRELLRRVIRCQHDLWDYRTARALSRPDPGKGQVKYSAARRHSENYISPRAFMRRLFSR